MSKRTLAFGLAVTLLLTLAGTALAAGKLTVAQETFFVLPYSTYYQGVVYAELTNSGDKPVELSGGRCWNSTTKTGTAFSPRRSTTVIRKCCSPVKKRMSM